jgi:hypothetical protein
MQSAVDEDVARSGLLIDDQVAGLAPRLRLARAQDTEDAEHGREEHKERHSSESRNAQSPQGCLGRVRLAVQ